MPDLSSDKPASIDRTRKNYFLMSRIFLNRNSIRTLETRIFDLNTLIRDRIAKLAADGYFLALDRERFDHLDRLAEGSLSLICARPDSADSSIKTAAVEA